MARIAGQTVVAATERSVSGEWVEAPDAYGRGTVTCTGMDFGNCGTALNSVQREISVRVLLATLVERSGQALGPREKTRAFGMTPQT